MNSSYFLLASSLCLLHPKSFSMHKNDPCNDLKIVFLNSRLNKPLTENSYNYAADQYITRLISETKHNIPKRMHQLQKDTTSIITHHHQYLQRDNKKYTMHTSNSIKNMQLLLQNALFDYQVHIAQKVTTFRQKYINTLNSICIMSSIVIAYYITRIGLHYTAHNSTYFRLTFKEKYIFPFIATVYALQRFRYRYLLYQDAIKEAVDVGVQLTNNYNHIRLNHNIIHVPSTLKTLESIQYTTHTDPLDHLLNEPSHSFLYILTNWLSSLFW